MSRLTAAYGTIDKQSAQIEELERRLDAAKIVLGELGYELKESYDPYFSWHESEYRLTDDAKAAAQEKKILAEKTHLDEMRAAEAQAESATRRETLEKVIEALGLKAYQRAQLGRAHAAAAGASGVPVYRDGVHVSTNRIDADAFWADIDTALTVRAERKIRAERDATEVKVTRLTQDAYAPGDRIAFFVPHIAPNSSTADYEVKADGGIVDNTEFTKPKKKAAKAKKEEAA